MNAMPGRALLLLGIASLLLVTPVPIQTWQLDHLDLRRFRVPPVLSPVVQETSADFDGDGLWETLTLVSHRAVIRTENKIGWQSPETWQVEQARVTDLNRDGVPEVTLLVWRAFQPWRVDAWLPHGGRIDDFHDVNEMSCHIILIGWQEGSYRELWAGSAMANPVKSFTVADLMGNGRPYLVALEAEYDDPPLAPARRIKVWEWNGFGFTAVSETEGSFRLMGVAQMENRQILILSP